ncbi:MAG TPA: SCO family protein, partial [Pseudohaliea sp.]|nr:SCO family protein [Pseudohaliea sp.]
LDAAQEASRSRAGSGAADFSGVDLGGDFTLTDHTGAAVSTADFDSDYLLIYFGYAFCPDVCPTELAKMAQAIDLLGEPGDRVQPLFVSIDPERDTPAMLADYVPLFHPRLVGLTGSPAEIAETAEAYRAYYRRVESEEYTYYLMDHSSFIYLTDGTGDLLYLFAPRHTPDDMAATIRAFMDGGVS